MRQRKKEAAPQGPEAANAPSTSTGGSSSAAALASGLKYLVGERFENEKELRDDNLEMVSSVDCFFSTFSVLTREKEK